MAETKTTPADAGADTEPAEQPTTLPEWVLDRMCEHIRATDDPATYFEAGIMRCDACRPSGRDPSELVPDGDAARDPATAAAEAEAATQPDPGADDPADAVEYPPVDPDTEPPHDPPEHAEPQPDDDGDASIDDATGDDQEPDAEPDPEPEHGEGWFEARTSDGAPIQGFVYALNKVVDEAKLEVDPDGGLRAKAVDPAHVAMFDATLAPEVWDAWDAEPGTIGLDVEKLWGLLKSASTSDGLALAYHPDDHEFVVEVNGMRRTISRVDPAGMSEPKEPDLEFPADLAVDVENVYTAIKQARDVSDHVAWTTAPGEPLTLRAEGEIDRFEWAGGRQRGTSKDTKALYSLDYLKSIFLGFKSNAKSRRVSDEVRVRYGTDYPAKLTVAGDHVAIEAMLAPRIESE